MRERRYTDDQLRQIRELYRPKKAAPLLDVSVSHIIDLAKGTRRFGRGEKSQRVAEYFDGLLNVGKRVDTIHSNLPTMADQKHNALLRILNKKLNRADTALLFQLSLVQLHQVDRSTRVQLALEAIAEGKHKEEAADIMECRSERERILTKLSAPEIAALYDLEEQIALGFSKRDLIEVVLWMIYPGFMTPGSDKTLSPVEGA